MATVLTMTTGDRVQLTDAQTFGSSLYHTGLSKKAIHLFALVSVLHCFFTTWHNATCCTLRFDSRLDATPLFDGWGQPIRSRRGEVISLPNEYVAAHHSSKIMAHFYDMMISFHGLPSTIFLLAACSVTILPKYSIEYPLCLVKPANQSLFHF